MVAAPRAISETVVRADARRVLLLASSTSYRVAAYREAALGLGLDLTVACDGTQALISDVLDGVRIAASGDVVALEREHARRSFCAVLSVDDSTAELAVEVAARLGLPHNPPNAARYTRRKDLARECLAAAGVPVPVFRRLNLRQALPPQLAGMEFPCVVKPIAMSGSRGVIRADNQQQLLSACERVRAIAATAPVSEERETLLVEAYLDGVEVAVEGLLTAGQLEVLAVFDKPEPLEGPFFEETYFVTPTALSPVLEQKIRRTVAQAARAYGLRQGPVHAEVRVDNGHVAVLEIAARTIGGDCARLLRFGTGQSLETLVLANATGIPVSARRMQGAAGVLMIPIPGRGVLRRVEGVLDAMRVPLVEDVVIAVREGYELIPLPEGASYLGFVFAAGPDAAAVESALRAAHACLNVVVAPVWQLQPLV